jgi:hypothetical protein
LRNPQVLEDENRIRRGPGDQPSGNHASKISGRSLAATRQPFEDAARVLP